MVQLNEVISYLDSRLRLESIKDFNLALNGLQIQNNGFISKIGAAVDVGLVPLEMARRSKIDLLICHHGLYWEPIIPIIDHNYEKIKIAINSNIAVYSAHLPLDCHPEIGNNALLAKELELEAIGNFLNYEGTDIGLICSGKGHTLDTISNLLKKLFPETYNSIIFGSKSPEKIAILTGSGQSAINELKSNNIDTLITGELKQHHFNIAQELKLNLFPCGHYATETFGVKALAKEISQKFNLEWTFLNQECNI